MPLDIKQQVLFESGYRCSVPTCRSLITLDIHHIVEVSHSGPDKVSNLIALCPTCHALYTRGHIPQEAISTWKAIIVTLSQAFDKESITNLLFLYSAEEKPIDISGDGVLKFNQLIASSLAEYTLLIANGPLRLYRVRLTDKGRNIVEAWYSGDRERVRSALGREIPT